jgi:parvulin-like peptidyl-prolyl isomerase
MLRHRDPLSGRLWSDEDQAHIKERLRDIRSRIRPDGINFPAVAQNFSEDPRSARQGGEIGYFGRLDQRLPAIIVREAWRLRDGEWAGPFESPEGMHFVRRTAFAQHTYILLQGKELFRVRAHLRALRQEELVFELRAKRKLELRI